MKHVRLFFIGMLMGIADLIPGISGGTIAFISGIYEELITSIKTLQLHAWKKIAWPFLLTLILGILCSIVLFSRLFYYLFEHCKPPLFGFFFGLMIASIFSCSKECKIREVKEYVILLAGFALSLGLTLLPSHCLLGTSFIGLLCAGALGSAAMLLPGISGSFLLQVLGVYPLVIASLAHPLAPGSCKLLLALGIGIAFGFICFSRCISFFLNRFPSLTLSLLIGFMAGGLKALWPFSRSSFILPLLFLLLGFFTFIFLEMSMKRFKAKTKVSN